MTDDLPDDLELADAVAFVLAHLRGDERLVNAQLDMHETWKLFAATTALLVRLLDELGGVDAAALERTLADWQERRRGQLLD